LQTQPVGILRSPQSFTLLHQVFRPLGQIAPVELGPRSGIKQMLSNQALFRYPIFATCSDLQALDGINYPIFLLARSGASLNEPVSGEAGLQITSLSHRVITSVALKLIQEPAQAQGLIHSEAAPSINELALEGQRVVESLSPMEGFDFGERELPLLEQVLSRIQPEDARQCFRHDPQGGLVFIRCRRLLELTPEVTRKPLYAELAARNPEVKLQGSHDIACPADWFLEVLAKFYGRAVT